ncbi:IS110 family transposase [Burkholderia diffusa]|uniref:Transposase, IS111A/IS1328/IS1533 n=2 Tax=Burkholderia cepacia complex TaxID=87882 RepID=A0A6P2RJC1_9BURK|nr:IS110 family transposase [Burkholderia diffusa]KAB0645006.1 IS110 family transposase [Burkholderia diffusa]MBM2657075.1 IS110 family transposase [Burkholderia diffusa]VWC30380.1 transposase, IS111A/IS1328/IS1533 [Burkholderia diffusa]
MADLLEGALPLNLVAIDIARYSNAVLIESSDGKRQRFRMTNNASDFDQLLSYLQALPGNCRVALEPTGDYHRPLAHRLLTAGHEVVSINSVAQARYREAMFNSWDKNDPKDAQVILEMLRRGTYQRYVDPQIAGHHDLQELAKTYYQVSRARTKVQHSLINHCLPLYFPEMHRYWCTTRNEWFVRFLLEFPTPTHVRALDRESFVAAAWDLVGRKVNKRAKLEEIWETAAHTAALPHAPDCLAVETFRITLRRYQELNVLRAAIEARAEAELHDNADFAHLKTLPGIGSVIAMTILAEAGDLRRFGHHRQFLKFCGFDLAKIQSGTQRGREQLSKRGNARLRLAFWMAGMAAVRMKENSFRSKYERYVHADPDDADLKRKALTAVAAKMARVAYSMIKKNQPYRQFFELGLPSGSIPLSAAVGAQATP